MLVLDFKDKNYKSFIDFATKTCDCISLIFEKDKINNLHFFQDILYLISDNIIDQKNILFHPDTGSYFENASIMYIKIDNFAISILKKANSIYDWNGQNFPEELCFYRNKKLWFSCTCHEQLLFVYNETEEDLKFFDTNNIQYFKTGTQGDGSPVLTDN